MNYNEKHPTISFRTDRKYKILLEKDADKDHTVATQIANDIIKKYYDGTLVDKESDTVLELQKLRIEKLKQEIKYLQIKNNFADNFHAPLSRSATVHIKPEIIVENNNPTQEIQQSPYDAKNRRIQCVECGVLFFWRTNSAEMKWVIDQYKQHLLVKHGRNMTAFESDVINNLEFEGASL